MTAPALPALVDTHAHIQEAEFREDADEVIARALRAGVRQMVVPAVDLESAQRAIALAGAHESVFATAGYHPHDANRLDEQAFEGVESLLTVPKVVAVGEIGLDYFRMHSTREEQLGAIEKQLELAGRHTLPIIVHCRDAWEDTEALLSAWAGGVSEGFNGRPLGVMHYFSGGVEQAEFFAGLGFLISLHTSVTHPRSTQMREVAASLPLEFLVLETDAPYGAPQSVRGKRNEPCYIVESCRVIAQERGISETQVAKVTTSNARRLFGLPDAGA